MQSTEQRARVHAALGDPLRLAIVDALRFSDLSPDELGSILGVRSNLLAHHLQVLERAGLIERSVSQGDRRRRYLHLDEAQVRSAWEAPTLPARTLLFICTRNSARSPIAAALWNEASAIPAVSAGTRPAEQFHPKAVEAARRAGFELGDMRPQHLADVPGPVDLVVSVCDQARESLPRGERPSLHWSTPDPADAGTDEAFDRTLELLRPRIAALARCVSLPAEQDRRPRDRER